MNMIRQIPSFKLKRLIITDLRVDYIPESYFLYQLFCTYFLNFVTTYFRFLREHLFFASFNLFGFLSDTCFHAAFVAAPVFNENEMKYLTNDRVPKIIFH